VSGVAWASVMTSGVSTTTECCASAATALPHRETTSQREGRTVFMSASSSACPVSEQPTRRLAVPNGNKDFSRQVFWVACTIRESKADYREANMRKLLIAIMSTAALMLGGTLAWNAQATPLSGTTATPPSTNYSPVETVACGIRGVCGRGRTLVCRPLGGCWCAPCRWRWR
jgi:hypothetical protein